MVKIMKLTASSIEEDIRVFEQRIKVAEDKLAELPSGYLPYSEHKKREHQRRVYQDEIRHVENILTYARQARQES